MRIGIDFGSTYSTVAKYFPESDTVEALTLMEGEPSSIPSVVSISKKMGSKMFGSSAKKKVGKSAFTIYDGFKMLLVESDEKMLGNRGYSSITTPHSISRDYLEYLLSGIVNRYGNNDNTIEEAVICVPEIWSSRVRTIDGRNILRDILSNEINLPNDFRIEKVKVVTEPEAACAFFAHNYERENNKKFNGHILLIDYGGGTLDITLMEVISNDDLSMEIGYRESGGIGENHPDSNGNLILGNAGIAYMQRVAAIAIQENDLIPENAFPDYSSSEFNECVHELEDLLKDPKSIQKIEFNFGQLGDYTCFDDIFEEECEELGTICFGDEEIPITYQQLFLAYKNVIEGAVKNEIDKICAKAIKHINQDPRTIESGMRDDFKIALVGGFGSFYLVRKQIESIFNIDTNLSADLRVKNIDLAKGEQAIALGAGLLASGRVVLQKTARFSIGLYSRSTDKRNKLSYGIRWHQEIKPEQPYFLLCDNEEEDKIYNRNNYGALRNNITHFVVEFSSSMNKGTTMALKPVFLKKLEEIPDGGIWNCGFSMDSDEVISFHIVPRKGQDPKFSEIVIRLDSYTNLFDLTAGEEVVADEI